MSDWRLPATPQPDATCDGQYDPGPPFPLEDYGFNCKGSELGHMFYNNLGATAGSSILAGSNATNLALFTNIQPDVYWSAEYAPGTIAADAWLFDAINGLQSLDDKVNDSTRGPCAPAMSLPPCPSRPVLRWSG